MKILGKVRNIHFVGIGGIGMSGIAELLINLGYHISGCDLKESSITKRLEALGARISYCHDREHINGIDVVVYSSAISSENLEIIEAKKKAIPVISRAEMLAELMHFKYGIAVSGAHGKTTTTCMIASVLNAANIDPTVVIGGKLSIWDGSNARLGQGDVLVAEADESDGSFLRLSCAIAVVTNIDYEHMDYYKSMHKLREAFIGFINKVPFYGAAIICFDDEEIKKIIPCIKRRYLTYGIKSKADLRAINMKKKGFGTSFEIVYKNTSLGEVYVGMPGIHNVLNALAAIGVGIELDLDIKSIKEGLSNIGGLERRFQIKGRQKDIIIMDDYGHHPTEILATLRTIKEWWPERRLVVAFQPHRYSRTKALFDKFVKSFNDADILLLNPIYPASEKPIKNISSKGLGDAIKRYGHKNVILCKGFDETLSALLSIVRPGDMVLTLGAGNIYQVANKLLEELKKRC